MMTFLGPIYQIYVARVCEWKYTRKAVKIIHSYNRLRWIFRQENSWLRIKNAEDKFEAGRGYRPTNWRIIIIARIVVSLRDRIHMETDNERTCTKLVAYRLVTCDKGGGKRFYPCSFVCLSVSKITEKRVHGFGWNVACRQMSGHGRAN